MTYKSLEERVDILFKYLKETDDRAEIHIGPDGFKAYVNPECNGAVPQVESDSFEELIEGLESEFEITH